MHRTLLLVVLAALAACSSSSDNACVKGDTRTCVCEGGKTGGQKCSADLAGWDDCKCDGSVIVVGPSGAGSGEGSAKCEATRTALLGAWNVVDSGGELIWCPNGWSLFSSEVSDGNSNVHKQIGVDGTYSCVGDKLIAWRHSKLGDVAEVTVTDLTAESVKISFREFSASKILGPLSLTKAGDGKDLCAEKTGSDCKGELCASYGVCTAKVGTCLVSSDSDCAGSKVCWRDGRCSVEDGICVAKHDADCQKSEDCKEDGDCSAYDHGMPYLKDCHPSTAADCKSSLRCAQYGECNFCPATCTGCKAYPSCEKGPC